MMEKRRTTESSTPGRADLRRGMCRRGVSSPLAIVASLLAASIIFFSALSKIAEHGEKKPKPILRVIQLYILLQGNVTESQRILKGQHGGSSAVTWHQHMQPGKTSGQTLFAPRWTNTGLTSTHLLHSQQSFPNILELTLHVCHYQ